MRTVRLGLGRGLRIQADLERHKRLLVGLYEIELDRWLRLVCRTGYGAFDVGGQLGYDALVLAKRTGGRVVTFECDASWCDAIRRAISANPSVGQRIDLVQAFVGADDDTAAGRVSLDAHAARVGWDPDVVKLDIEGAEHDALKGAAELIARRRPHLIVEVHSAQLERECGAWLVERGYKPRVLSQRSFMPDYRPTSHNRWLIAIGSW